MKSEFVSTVSHELRTPLTSIRGALGLVIGTASGEIPDNYIRLLELADRNGERLMLLINDILDLEKIQAGRLEFEFGQVDLVALACIALEENEGFAHEHSVHLRFDTDLESATIYGDKNRLLQVLANLISNAVKFSAKGDTVDIRVTWSGESYRVEVCDHGPGIPDEFKKRIFQRFAQADSSDSREKGGTGLGLSISKAIVDYHQGNIGYETKTGVGSVFHFDLPAWNPADESVGSNNIVDRKRRA